MAGRMVCRRLSTGSIEQSELTDDDTRGWLVDAGFAERIGEAALASER